MPSFDNIDYRVVDGRGEILLDRPEKLNAYDDGMLDELDACVEEAMSDDDVRAVILSGRGRAFCSGVDLDATVDHARTKRTFETHRAQVDAVYRGLYKGTTPTIAAINGPAIGAGFGFALTCDFRVMAEDAFLRDQHLNVGLTPSVGAGWLLPRLIGESKAKEFVLTSQDVSPEQAADCGLVRRVVEPGETMAAARELAATLVEKPPTAVRGTLDLMNTRQSFEEYVRSATEWQWTCKRRDDHTDALSDVRGDQSPSRTDDDG
jgi:enoyl-CoA hydratase/carnithine racemase